MRNYFGRTNIAFHCLLLISRQNFVLQSIGSLECYVGGGTRSRFFSSLFIRAFVNACGSEIAQRVCKF